MRNLSAKMLVGLLLTLSANVFADIPAIVLEKAPIHRDDKASLMRGAKFFAANCISCHTLKYLRYDKLAHEAGVTYEKMPINAKWPADAIPPDLSLVADVRGVNWVFTYLHSFYTDPTSKTGYNNLLVVNTKMPGILAPFQGQQSLSTDLKASETIDHKLEWYDVLTLDSNGSVTPAQFDQDVTDVVNFLAYAAAPFHAEQVKIGKWVMVYLLVLLVLVFFLKREYWKDMH